MKSDKKNFDYRLGRISCMICPPVYIYTSKPDGIQVGQAKWIQTGQATLFTCWQCHMVKKPAKPHDLQIGQATWHTGRPSHMAYKLIKPHGLQAS